MRERAQEPCNEILERRLQKKNRVRRHVVPDSGGLFSLEMRVGNGNFGQLSGPLFCG